MAEFKVGDKAQAIKNCGSGSYSIGDVLTVVEICCEGTDNLHYALSGARNGWETTWADPDHLTKYGNDAINPSHYKQKGGIETIDYMKAVSSVEEYRGHLRLTAVKYLSRLGKKDEAVQEVKKSIWYLNKLVESLEEEV